ncbi:MAG: hypothetical protein K0B37_10425, partial [Bacteroidales bacterium]|nr:hypothetical protein [Bacteroidales bacterium]
DYYSPVEKKWISFEIFGSERVSESRLPEWAWSSTFMSDIAGFVVPTDDGPVWIALDWGNCSYSAISGIGKCIGGVAVLQNHVMVPSRLEDAIIINTFDHTALKWLQVCTIAETDISESRADTFFSIPVVDERRQEIYWIGFRGRLIYSKAQGSCAWQPWETDQYPCRAIPELGPPYRDKLGEFWQLCYDKDESSGVETIESYRYYKLKGDESDREDVLRAMFCSGISCFSRNYAHWESPWDAVDEKLHRENLETVLFRVPLLCLNYESKATVTASFGKGLFLPPFLLINDFKTAHVTNLLVETPNERPFQLKTNSTLTLPAPWELRLFIYQNVLFAYHARTQAFCSWRLK